MRNCIHDTELVGIILDREKFPYTNYTKEESDARYPTKSETEKNFQDVDKKIEVLAKNVSEKAAQTSLDAMYRVVDKKASAEELSALSASLNEQINSVANAKVNYDEFNRALASTISKNDIENLFKE